ncbi:MFS transporter permease [Virgisporangium ochraceum]|uniref:MFS transporter permease n=1 Tax=Virgisporangium ochraceum TaxID=65505 RepID=UPI0027DA5901|nr:MFS transporter permease [Virgisporangium ochraceum]
MDRVTRWLTEPVPKGRIAAFRTLVYLFVAADITIFTGWVRAHAGVPGDLYRPLYLARVLHLPVPTRVLVLTIFWTLLAAALAAATGRAHRLLGWPVFLLYLEWMIIAMSYGKVDHDRFGLLVALAVLPTAGRARHGDPTLTERGGWALRMTQFGAIATYFLAAWAKLRFGGIAWLTGATLTRAVVRRGTVLADQLVKIPNLMVISQFGIMAFELLSPLILFLPRKWQLRAVAACYAFHVMVMATITISFLPHQVAMASFLPLERVRPVEWVRRWRQPAAGGRIAQAAVPPGRRWRLRATQR